MPDRAADKKHQGGVHFAIFFDRSLLKSTSDFCVLP